VQGRIGECQRWLVPLKQTRFENCNERSTGRPRPTPGEGSTPGQRRDSPAEAPQERGGEHPRQRSSHLPAQHERLKRPYPEPAECALER